MLLRMIFSMLLSWGCMPCDTCSFPLLVLCTIYLIHVVPIMRGNLDYYEVLLLHQVGIMVCGWNQILQICEYRLICGEGLLIAWENLLWLLPDVRVCTTIEDESICLHCTVPLWNGSWIFESLSLHCFICDDLEGLTDNWFSWKSLSSFNL